METPYGIKLKKKQNAVKCGEDLIQDARLFRQDKSTNSLFILERWLNSVKEKGAQDVGFGYKVDTDKHIYHVILRGFKFVDETDEELELRTKNLNHFVGLSAEDTKTEHERIEQEHSEYVQYQILKKKFESM